MHRPIVVTQFTRHLVTSLAGLLLVFLASPNRGLAVGCPWSPDHWYNITVSIVQDSLPVGTTATTHQDAAGNNQVLLKNVSTTSLTINPTDPYKTYAEPYPRPLTMRLVAGNAYFCNVQIKPIKCDLDARTNPKNAYLDTPEIEEAILTSWVVKDDRPNHVTIPESRHFEFAARYGDKKISIRGMVSFSLNDRYDPKLGQKSKALCGMKGSLSGRSLRLRSG
jgi:hypothetical protein